MDEFASPSSGFGLDRKSLNDAALNIKLLCISFLESSSLTDGSFPFLNDRLEAMNDFIF